MGIVKAGVVLWCHEAIVFNGYQGWTTQRSSARGIYSWKRMVVT